MGWVWWQREGGDWKYWDEWVMMVTGMEQVSKIVALARVAMQNSFPAIKNHPKITFLVLFNSLLSIFLTMLNLLWLVQLTPKLLAKGKGRHQWDGSELHLKLLVSVSHTFAKRCESISKVLERSPLLDQELCIRPPPPEKRYTFFFAKFGKLQNLMPLLLSSVGGVKVCRDIWNSIMNSPQTVLIKAVDN